MKTTEIINTQSDKNPIEQGSSERTETTVSLLGKIFLIGV